MLGYLNDGFLAQKRLSGVLGAVCAHWRRGQPLIRGCAPQKGDAVRERGGSSRAMTTLAATKYLPDQPRAGSNI